MSTLSGNSSEVFKRVLVRCGFKPAVRAAGSPERRLLVKWRRERHCGPALQLRAFVSWPGHTHAPPKSVRPPPRTQPGSEVTGQVRPGPRLTPKPALRSQAGRAPPGAGGARVSPQPTRPEPRGRPEDRVVRWAAARPRLRPEPEPAQKEGKPEDKSPKGRPSPACRAEGGPEGGASLESHLDHGPRGQRWECSSQLTPIGPSRLRNRSPENSRWTRSSAPSPAPRRQVLGVPCGPPGLRVARAARKARLEGRDGRGGGGN
uniref:Uncharacterized protein n=1 Tax=Rangifer tarandus platyrhynchus TaxID=3082113 RepID=A0ACB0FC79_RANTA|nr:unnamed protein product [Rangifer tarandus platyrhynchus]